MTEHTRLQSRSEIDRVHHAYDGEALLRRARRAVADGRDDLPAVEDERGVWDDYAALADELARDAASSPEPGTPRAGYRAGATPWTALS